jgi:hypothetical protein
MSLSRFFLITILLCTCIFLYELFQRSYYFEHNNIKVVEKLSEKKGIFLNGKVNMIFLITIF